VRFGIKKFRTTTTFHVLYLNCAWRLQWKSKERRYFQTNNWE